MSLRSVVRSAEKQLDFFKLPGFAKREQLRDMFGRKNIDSGFDRSITESMEWLARSQDNSATKDGGAARHFSFTRGWGASYPETSGYIVPTLIAYGHESGSTEYLERAVRMLDWLVSIQLPGGGFQGGTVDLEPVVPVTFNTGQILLGLADGAREFGEKYNESMNMAATWLVDTQDSDGCWRKHHSPFAGPGDKTYETHVAWGLLEAARIAPDRGYGEAALRNIHWALTQQTKNGWFENCCLSRPTIPLTHTIGYALRGIVEGYRFSRQDELLQASLLTADALLKTIQDDGYLPGRFDANWNPAVNWSCLTGTVQIAHCWLLLYQETNDSRYLSGASKANKFVRTTLDTNGNEGTRGGIKGSYPVSGLYGRYEYLNWAAKFFVDSNMLERQIAGNSE